MKTRAQDKFGRNPDHLKVMPGLSVYVGRTEAEANEKYDYQNSLMHPIVAREILSTVLGGVDLSPYDFDGPLPESADAAIRATARSTTSPGWPSATS